MVLTIDGVHGDDSMFMFRMREKNIDYFVDGQLLLQWRMFKICAGRDYIRIKLYGGKVRNGKIIDQKCGEIFIRSMRAMFIGFDDIPLTFTCDDAFCSAFRDLKAADKKRYIVGMPIAVASGRLSGYEAESPIVKRIRVQYTLLNSAVSEAELDRVQERFEFNCCELRRERPDLAMLL